MLNEIMKKEIDKIFNININELRKELYKKYSRKQIADKLQIKERQVSRLLNGYSVISIKQFQILIEMIK